MKIEGIIINEITRINHSKGDIFHVIKDTDIGYKGFGEAYISTIKNGEIKAWKKHKEMTLNLVVPLGDVRFVFFDDREGSKTKGVFYQIIIGINNYIRLTVPPNIWMGFQAVEEDSYVLNIANIKHDPKEQINTSIDDSSINFNWNEIL